MPDGPIDISLTAQFSAIAKSGIAAEVAATWNEQLPRVPRLLVPVDVRALVVPKQATVERAGIGVRLYADADNPIEKGERAPAPFTDLDARPPGVYLHWAMPDGLTRGHVDDALNLRALPDRWLVMRVEPGPRRNVRGWVLDSDRARCTELSKWSEPGPLADNEKPEPYIPPRDLHAMAGGDPAWAAIFDNVVNRFAFHDDLSEFETTDAQLAYVVAGWYSDPELDPLFLGDTESSFETVLSSLGWTLDDSRVSPAIMKTVVKSMAATALGLKSEMFMQRIATLPTDGLVSLLPPVLLGDALDVIQKPEPWWPRQSLYHGAIYGVRPDGEGTDERPAPNAVAMAVGTTQVEGTAALLASQVADGFGAAERLQTAFGYGILEAFGKHDGPTRLEEEMHAQAFASAPGGTITEFVRAGNPLEHLRKPRPQKIHVPLINESDELKESLLTFDFVLGTRRDAMHLLLAKQEMAREESVPDEVRIEEVTRALPRYYFPADPVVVLRGLNRSLRHGYDGVLEPDERLHCRISGSEIKSLAGLIRGADLLATPLNHGGIPTECEEMLREAILQDPFAADDVVATAVEATGLDREAVKLRVFAERQLFLHGVAGVGDVAHLLPASIREGIEPSPLAVTLWRQAWVPLYLEWEIEIALGGLHARWSLGELDLEPTGEATKGETIRLTGRSLLTSSSAKNLRDRINKVLTEEEKLEGEGLIAETDEDLLRELANAVGNSDLVGAGLDGLRESLLGFEGNVAWEGKGETTLAPKRPPRLLRAGSFKFLRARVVDAFGRTLEIEPGAVASEVLRSEKPDRYLLRPRINAHARLLARLIDGNTATVPPEGSNGRFFEGEASVDQRPKQTSISPIAGWLLPDHVDGALEVFDAQGYPVGQLLHEPLSGAVTWEGAPGTPSPLGELPERMIPNQSVAAMISGLLRRDAVDRTSGKIKDEDCLSALLRVIDTTTWTIDPFGTSGPEYLGMLIGRPIAIVRAVVKLDIRDDSADYGLGDDARAKRAAAFASFTGCSFEVKLGALTRSQDGLLGYFVDDNYSQFHPVHPQVLRDAIKSGPRMGYLGSMEEAAQFHAEADKQSEEIEQAYVSHDPTIDITAGRARILTLLMVPDASVHVTSGILPRKSLSLLREWLDEPLKRILPSLRVGPVLVDPDTIRMPKPVYLGTDQLWTRRDSATSWRDDPIVAATQEAILPKGSAEAQEGYIRVRPHP